jgi:uncharacterized coiled-coil protein SlyX
MLDVLNEPKTWSEIKLRRPSAEICDTMQFIISDFSEISASKALEKLIVNYPKQKERIQALEASGKEQRQRISQLEAELAEQKKLVAAIRQSYNNFTALLSD